MMRPLKQSLYWALDYLYVVRAEIAMFFHRESHESYRSPGGKPVILLPGVYEHWRFMRPIATVLHRSGYDVHVLDELGFNVGTVASMAAQVVAYCDRHGLTGAALVSHSKGGLIGKHLLMNDADGARFTRLIALNAPFSGSLYAYLLPLKSLRIFTPHSPIVTLLASDSLSNARITSLYGMFDPHIPSLSHLAGATNVQLDTYGHFRPLSDSKVHEAILSALASDDA